MVKLRGKGQLIACLGKALFDHLRRISISAYQTAGGAPYLDYTDTVLGQVYEGMDVVDAIGQTAVDENQKPSEDITINSVSIEAYQ